MADVVVTQEPILKGVGKINGDGWKDTTKVGEVVFVWNTELPSPYSPGLFPRVGCEVWAASRDQYDFVSASAAEVRELFTQAHASGLAEGRKQGIEEAAKVAEQEPPFKHGPAITRDAYRKDIAAAIRAIGDKE